jgi:D-alanyl-D-alanine dipeptidase/outer membrane protein assembly factor BamB
MTPRALPLLLLLLVFGAPVRADRDDEFVELKRLDPTIVIELPYATEDNFCKAVLYPVERCFLRRKVAEALLSAHRSLADRGLGLKVWDGYRPHSVQYLMWEKSPLPGFVGHPKEGSKHNRGAAVDVTLVELATGNELPMPTPYDEFSPRARRGYLKVSAEIAENRRILQTGMRANGFMTIESEWWHFDHRDWSQFPLADFSLETLAAQSDRDAKAEEVKATTAWPRFRGPNGTGLVDSTVPLHWSATENVKWRLDLPGPGSSSPIVWGDRVFVTCYTGYGDGKKAEAEPLDLVRHLLCVDLASGKRLWTASEPAAVAENEYKEYLPEHGYASNTPATDGERVYCFYGKNGVHAYDFSGKKVWSAPTGTMSSAMTWGSASSVVFAGEAVVVNAGDEARALLAFDRTTGKELWRMEDPMLEQTYATPSLQRIASDRTDLLVAIRGELRGLDPASGAIRWKTASPVTGNLSAGPVPISGNRIALFGGFPRTIGTVFQGGGEGDRSADAMLWESQTAKSYMPLPVEHEGLLYWVSDDGIAACAKPESGELLYRERLNVASETGKGMAFYASPILVGDHLIAVSRSAGTFVIEASPTFKLFGVNRIEDDPTRFQGTPAVAGGVLLLRSEKALYAIGK